MTAKGACEVLECSGQKLWRIERGLTAMRALDVKVMCEVYGADERTTEALMALAKSTKERGWWHAYGKTVPAWFRTVRGAGGGRQWPSDLPTATHPGPPPDLRLH